MLISLAASFPAKYPSPPGRWGSSTCKTSASVYESPAPFKAFLALFTLSTRSCTEPSVPGVVVSKDRMLTLASPSTLATCAREPWVPKQISVRGFVYDVKTGKLKEVAEAHPTSARGA